MPLESAGGRLRLTEAREERGFTGRLEALEGPAEISIQEVQAGETTIRLVRGTKTRFVRTPEFAAAEPAHRIVTYILRGADEGAFGGVTYAARAGEVTAFDTRAAGASEVEDGTALLVLITPSPRHAPLRAPVVKLRPSTLTRGVQAFASAALREGTGEHDTAPELAKPLGGLLECMLAESDALGGHPCGNEIGATIDRFIQRAIADPALSPAMIAEELGISRRALYYAFDPIFDEGPAAYIRSQRLDRVEQRLRAADRLPDLAALAGEVGFGSADRLARVLSARHGVSPRTYWMSQHPPALGDC